MSNNKQAAKVSKLTKPQIIIIISIFLVSLLGTYLIVSYANQQNNDDAKEKEQQSQVVIQGSGVDNSYGEDFISNQDYITYTNPQYPDISIKYPSDWTVEYIDKGVDAPFYAKNNIIRISKDGSILDINMIVGYPNGASIYRFYGYRDSSFFVRKVKDLGKEKFLARFKDVEEGDTYLYLNSEKITQQQVPVNVGADSLLRAGNYSIAGMYEDVIRKPGDDEMMNDNASIYFYFKGDEDDAKIVDDIVSSINYDKINIGEHSAPIVKKCSNCLSSNHRVYDKILKIGIDEFVKNNGSASYDNAVVRVYKTNGDWIYGCVEFSGWFLGDSYRFVTDGKIAGLDYTPEWSFLLEHAPENLTNF